VPIRSERARDLSPGLTLAVAAIVAFISGMDAADAAARTAARGGGSAASLRRDIP
jgi:hypothetical protein